MVQIAGAKAQTPGLPKGGVVTRKRLGRDLCLQETATVLRALQTEYDRLQTLAKRPKREASWTTHRPQPMPGFRDLVSHALRSRHLHLSSFVESDVARLLMPFNLDRNSIFVDCNEYYSQTLGLTRESVIRGARVSQLISPTNFLRIVSALPVLAVRPILCVRNVPAYSQNSTYDAIISVEFEDESCPSAADSVVVSPRKPKFLQMLFVNARPLQVPSAIVAVAPPVASTATSPDSMLLDDRQSVVSASSTSPPPLSPCESSLGSSAPAASENASCVMMVEDTVQQPWLSEQQRGEPRLVVLEAMYEPGHSDYNAQNSNLVWVSPWDNDNGGVGSPAPFVAIEAAAVETLFASSQAAVQSDQFAGLASPLDASSSPIRDVETPVLRFYPPA